MSTSLSDTEERAIQLYGVVEKAANEAQQSLPEESYPAVSGWPPLSSPHVMHTLQRHLMEHSNDGFTWMATPDPRPPSRSSSSCSCSSTCSCPSARRPPLRLINCSRRITPRVMMLSKFLLCRVQVVTPAPPLRYEATSAIFLRFAEECGWYLHARDVGPPRQVVGELTSWEVIENRAALRAMGMEDEARMWDAFIWSDGDDLSWRDVYEQGEAGEEEGVTEEHGREPGTG